MKYIFITGGVVSGLGKGICAASLGRLLKQRGLRVQNQKFDPYLNVDPGTMSPYQHGEVFVTDDGAETDLDLGHYERFTDESLTAGCSVSAGKVYWSVLCREREGGYLGRTVQIIPHITDEIKSRIYQMDNGKSDVLITEIGGTVGDIESQPFLEAIRQVAAEQGKKNVLFIHVPMIVEIPGSGELKSKPTQHSVKELLSIGIQPDILVCRTNQPMTEEICRKIALFCNMEPDCVIPNTTASTLYEVPLLLEKEGLARVVCRKLELSCGEPELTAWTQMVTRIKTASRHVTIALVGKYTELHDAYLSVEESLFHAGTANDVIVDIRWVDSSKLTPENAARIFDGCDLVIDALDSPQAKCMLEELCEGFRLPLVHGAVEGWFGQVCTVMPGDWTLRSLYQNTNRGDQQEAEKTGTPSFTPAAVAALQVSEALKVLLDKEGILRNEVLFLDLYCGEFQKIKMKKEDMGKAQGSVVSLPERRNHGACEISDSSHHLE